MTLTTQELSILARIRECPLPSAAEQIFIEYKNDLVYKAEYYARERAREQALEDLFKTIEYLDCPSSSDQWIIDSRKDRARKAIMEGIYE